MDKSKLDAVKALQEKPAAEILAALPSLERDALSELIAREADCNSPREDVTQAIAARIAEMDAESEPPPAKPSGKPAKVEAPAPKDPKRDHTHPDYSGPLTIEQANWRHANLKPVKAVKTK
jgi:hypothetical protein